MAHIKPFRGIRYNPERIADMAVVVCPPYDVISESEQTLYYDRSPYNMIRMELGKPYPDDDRAHNPHSRAGAYLRTWLDKGTLIQETLEKEKRFRELLVHRHIQEVRGKGLMLAIVLKDAKMADYLVLNAMKEGLLLFWLLFEPRAVRISPPLTLSQDEIERGCAVILRLLDRYPETHVN